MARSDANSRLFAAIAHADAIAVRQAIADGADLNARGPSGGETPLMQLRLCAAPRPIAELLFAAGADPRVTDLAGRSALHHLVYCRDPAVLDAALAAGADPAMRDRDDLRAFDVALGLNSDEVITRLLTAMPPPDTDDRTRLFLRALQRGNTDAALDWLAAGIRLSPLTPGAYPPLILAARRGDLRVACALMDAGAEIDARFGARESALMIAAQHGHADLVDLLLMRGADRDALDAIDASALHRAAGSTLAAESALLAVTTRLLDAGIDPLARTRDGYWPRALARQRGNARIAAALPAMPAEPPIDPAATMIASLTLARDGDLRLRWQPNDLLAPFAVEQHLGRDEWQGEALNAERLAAHAAALLREPLLAWFRPLLVRMINGEAVGVDEVRRAAPLRLEEVRFRRAAAG